MAQVFLGYNLLGQANTSSTITQAELYFMWCVKEQRKEQRKVHLGYWIAQTCHAIATRPVRHLNVCHILGAYVKNCLVLEVEIGMTNLPLCPDHELFDIKIFVNVQIVVKKGRRLHFYKVGKPDLQLARITGKKQDGEIHAEPVVPAARTESVGHVDEWRRRMEALVQSLAQNADAQRELLTAQANEIKRAVNTMGQMIVLVTRNLIPQR